MLLASEKAKKKLCFWGNFGILTWVFCIIKRNMRGILVFHNVFFIF
jgi:hypothetical protein